MSTNESPLALGAAASERSEPSAGMRGMRTTSGRAGGPSPGQPVLAKPRKRQRATHSRQFGNYWSVAIVALVCGVHLLADCSSSGNFDDYEQSSSGASIESATLGDYAGEHYSEVPGDSRSALVKATYTSLNEDADQASESESDDYMVQAEGGSRLSPLKEVDSEKLETTERPELNGRKYNSSTAKVSTTTISPTTKKPHVTAKSAVTTTTTMTTSRPRTITEPQPSAMPTTTKRINTLRPVLAVTTTSKQPQNKAQLAQAEKHKQAASDAKNAIQKAKNAPTTPKPTKAKVSEALEKLVKTEGKKVEAKRNTTIIINGRKFDQVNPIECVDEQFYAMLMEDLGLINPSETRDEYETYYDDERAKAISAIVEAPDSASTRRPTVRKSLGSRSDLPPPMDNMTSEQLLQDIKEYWNETNATYARNSLDLNMRFSRRKRAARKNRASPESSPSPSSTFKNNTIKTTSTNTLKSTKAPVIVDSTPRARPPAKVTSRPMLVIPNYRRALENHHYLLHRLEELKAMLLNGEEAIIILNNRVKKLQQAVGEGEIHQALCSCITSRGGRAALMLISELFTDKNAMKLLADQKLAKSKAEDAARDTAEFCSYWYGDTLRSQAIMKEKQIKRLITKIKRQHISQKIKTTTDETAISIMYVHEGLKTKKIISRETQIRVVTKVVEMTRLWQPELSIWIQSELGSNFTDGSVLNLNGTGRSGERRTRRHTDHDEMFMSTPFDQRSLYADVDDSNELESSGLLKSFILTNYQQPSRGRMMRARRQTDEDEEDVAASSKVTTRFPKTGGDSGASSDDEESESEPQTGNFNTTYDMKKSNLTTKKPPNKLKVTVKPRKFVNSTTTSAPTSSSTTIEPVSTSDDLAANFEQRTSASAAKCASDGFSVLLDIAYDENAILYETSRIKRNDQYIRALSEFYIISFQREWVNKRDEWSRVFREKTKEMAADANKKTKESKSEKIKKSSSESDENEYKRRTRPTAKIRTKIIAPSKHSANGIEQIEILKKDTQEKTITSQSKVLEEIDSSKTVDELIDDAVEPTGNSYERGARLGYTIGKFIGEKASRQWPDPAELNTFTYDSLFLAGIGHTYNEQQTKQLESLIVTETAKRVAFTEANRKAFAKALHSSYLNGAFIVPKFGVLHGQRAVAKRASIEGSQVGYEAASSAAREFAPQATKFFRLHEHQRALAAPYKKSRALGALRRGEQAPIMEDKKSLLGRLDEVAEESELNANISKSTVECGQKSGALMGALVALLVVPEAFETYARVRGSLEAVESEFYRYKLGALRGYELGESWAMLNYTNAMAKRLESMRDEIGKVNVIEMTRNKTSSTTTKKPKQSGSSTRNITRIPDDQMFSSMYDSGPEHTNVNNVFQFMVVNYGERVVANHSRSSMLKLRNLVALDENILTDIKVQSGDLVDISTDRRNYDEGEDVFETVQVAGELVGALNSSTEMGKQFPLKLEIIDLGPLIEFADESVKSNNQSSSIRSDSYMDVIPLTEALAKVNKLYIKLRVARGQNETTAKRDELETYLNSDQSDGGDGFLCGSYSHLGASRMHQIPSKTNSQQGQTFPRETEDDMALEAAMLDELYDRIEHTPLGKSSVEMTEEAMKVTTVAPSRIESIRKTASPTRATLAATKNPTENPMTPKYEGTRLPVKTTKIPISSRNKSSTSTTMKPVGSSTTATSTSTTPLVLARNLQNPQELVNQHPLRNNQKTENRTTLPTSS